MREAIETIRMMRFRVGVQRLRWVVTVSAVALLAGCAAPTTPWPHSLGTPWPVDVILLGERHDAADHQRLQREAVAWLAQGGRLAAVVMEMAEQGHSTRGLPVTASDADAQRALQWQDQAWPWQAYGPVVMEAVRAGVPVLGGNLPRAAMRPAMQEVRWDTHLPAEGLQRQYEALREGHCGLLPEAQIPGMARIQIARDAAMAQTVLAARKPGQAVLLIAGAGHVQKRLGVPTHWDRSVSYKVLLAQAGITQDAMKNEADAILQTPPLPDHDACAPLRALPPARSAS